MARGIDYLRRFPITDTEVEINQALAEGKNVLAEGAQGSLLDIDHGTYPFVSSSSTTIGGVCTGLGVAPQSIGRVWGIFKAYSTRVGSGPFPVELFDETGEEIRRVGREFGAVTGRNRRCGWVDLVALRYAIMINGVTDLVMMRPTCSTASKPSKCVWPTRKTGCARKRCPTTPRLDGGVRRTAGLAHAAHGDAPRSRLPPRPMQTT